MSGQESSVRAAAVVAVANLIWPSSAAGCALTPYLAKRGISLLADSCADETASVRTCALERLHHLGTRACLDRDQISTVVTCATESAHGSDSSAQAALHLLGSCCINDRVSLLEVVRGLIGCLKTHRDLEVEVHRLTMHDFRLNSQ